MVLCALAWAALALSVAGTTAVVHLPRTFNLPENTPTQAAALVRYEPTTGTATERSDSSWGAFIFDATGDGTADDVFVLNSGQANEVLIHDGTGTYSRLENSPLVERRWESTGGFAFDATGDGTADDVFVVNRGYGPPNEVLLSDGAGGYSRLENSPLLETADGSHAGFVFDATGDGTADDVFVVNENEYQPNEVYLRDAADGYTRLENSPLVERAGQSRGGFAFDATGDGTADDVFVTNVAQPNEVLLSDGAGGYSRLENSPLVERADDSYGAFLFDATGDGTANDVFVANSGQHNEVLLSDGAGGYSRLGSSPLVEMSSWSRGGVAFDATGDGTADDVYVINSVGESNEVLVSDGSGGYSRLANSPLIERIGTSMSALLVDRASSGVADSLFVLNQGEPNEFFVKENSSGYILLESSPLVERASDRTYGGFAFDATGDGTADDVFVLNAQQPNEVLLSDGAGGYSRLENSPLLEAADGPIEGGGFVFDATGDGTADDVFLATETRQPNEVYLRGAAGGYTRLENSPLVERADLSTGGFAFDTTGDGTPDDVFVTNVAQPNEVLLSDGAGGYSRLENSPLVERSDDSHGAFLFDATGDGTADDVFVANGGQHNEVLLSDGAGGYSRLGSSPLVERVDDSNGGFAFDATGDGTADDVFVLNGRTNRGQANEVLIHDGAGAYRRLENSPLVERADDSNGGFAFDATGDGTADDVFVLNDKQLNEVLLSDGAGGYSRLENSPLLETADDWSRAAFPFDATGDGTANDVFVAIFHARNRVLRRSVCYGEDGYAMLRGACCKLLCHNSFGSRVVSTSLFSYLSARLMVFLLADAVKCPTYSIGVFSGHQCRFCPAGKIAPTAANGEPIRGWPSSQPYVCGACEAGKYRAEDQHTDECVDCPVGRYSTAGQGECSTCSDDRIVNHERTGCLKCDPGEGPNSNGTACVCAEGHYDRRFGHILCFEQDYFADAMLGEAYTTARVQSESGQRCLACPHCVLCDIDSTPSLLPGWGLSPEGMELWDIGFSTSSPAQDLVQDAKGARSAFRCALNGEVCTNNATGPTKHQCVAGHTGVLCGACNTSYSGSFGQVCAKCTSQDWMIPLISLVGFLAVVGCLYSRLRSKADAVQGQLDSIRSRYKLARKAMHQAKKIHSDMQQDNLIDKLDEEGAFAATLDTLKVVIGNLQIIAQLPVTLKFSCPACLHMRKLMDILPSINLDLLSSFSADCIVEVGLYKRFMFAICSPIVLIAVVQTWYRTGSTKHAVEVQQETDTSVNGQGKSPSTPTHTPSHQQSIRANQLSMLIVFLVYPQASSTIFSVFACRTLDFEQSIHVYDANVDCNSDTYLAFRVLAVLALVCIPVGVPVVFAILLYKNRARLRQGADDAISCEVFESTARSVLKDQNISDSDLKYMYDTLDVDGSGMISSEELWKGALESVYSKTPSFRQTTAQISTSMHVIGLLEKSVKEARGTEQSQFLRKDPDMQAVESEKQPWWFGGKDEFKFLCGPYEPEFFWFELVHYGKKFVLSGVLIFATPGSTAQLYVGMIVSFYFFALLARSMPYKNPKTDQTAVMAEANLFLTLLCLLMLRINITGEWLSREFYDAVLASSNTVVALVPTSIAAALGLHRLASEITDSTHGSLSAGDRVLVLDCPTDLRCCGHVGKVVRSTDSGSIAVRIQLPSRQDMSLICCQPFRQQLDAIDHELGRTQLKLVLGRKQFVRLCVWFCKHMFMCWRSFDSSDDWTPDTETNQQVQESKSSVCEALELDSDDEASVDLKHEIMDMMRPQIQPRLEQHGILWEQAKEMVHKMCSLKQLHAALEDHESFTKGFVALVGPVIKQRCLAMLQPTLEPVLLQQGVTWEQAEPLFSSLTDINTLQAAVEDPESLVEELLSASGPAAKAFAIAKLQPVLEPFLVERGILGHGTNCEGDSTSDEATVALDWNCFVPVLKLVDTVEELQEAVENPQQFVDNMLAVTSTASKAFAISRLRPLLEVAVRESIGLDWKRFSPILQLIENLDDLNVAISNPEEFFESLLSTASPYALQVSLACLEDQLRPLVEDAHVTWEQAVQALELLDVEELRGNVSQPQVLLDHVIDVARLQGTDMNHLKDR